VQWQRPSSAASAALTLFAIAARWMDSARDRAGEQNAVIRPRARYVGDQPPSPDGPPSILRDDPVALLANSLDDADSVSPPSSSRIFAFDIVPAGLPTRACRPVKSHDVRRIREHVPEVVSIREVRVLLDLAIQGEIVPDVCGCGMNSFGTM
jgi:hypothetical protein